MFDTINGGGVTTPLGFSASVCVADIKGKGRGNADLGLLFSDEPCVCAGLFTKNIVKAAPVKYDMQILANGCDNIRAVVANSGNANACTGNAGMDICKKTAAAVADLLDIPATSILIASTGVIGQQMVESKIIDNIATLVEELSDDNGTDFAKAIMTTDLVLKEAAVFVDTKAGRYVIGGCCKGSGMIAPSLATMLTFITTDAKVPKELMQKAAKKASEVTFDCVTVDGDMSTNDTAIILANGMSGVKVDDSNFDDFVAALDFVCRTLAKKMAKDGEGASKFVTINIKGARSDDDAKLCASKIANSPLVKTMFAGCDPNWGRLMASAGASGAEFDPDMTDIFFNDIHYVKNGVIIDNNLEAKAYEIMKTDEYDITIDLKAGSGEAIFYTCDLTTGYIKINADYRS